MAVLGDYIRIKHGFAFKGDFITTEDNGIVLVTPGNFEIGGGFKEKKCKFFSGDYPAEYVLCPGDLIVTMTDLSKQGDTLGFSALVPNSKRTYLHNQRIGLVDVFNPEADREFIYWFMRTPRYQKTIVATASGSTVKHTSPSRICEVEIDLPPLNEQKAIAAILTAIDDKIELNEKINDNLLAQAQAIFMQRFIMDKIEGDEKPLYDFADYINGAAFKPSECGDHGLPIIKIVELKNGITDSTKYFDGFKGEKYLIQDKDILFSWSGNPDTSIDIFIWTHGKAILNQHTFNVKSNTGHRWFTFLMLKYFKPEFSRIASNKQTTGLGHVTATDLKRLTFVFNKDAIEAFEHEVSPFMETIYTNMMEKQRLEQLRDNLLPKLMSGEIDVSDIQL